MKEIWKDVPIKPFNEYYQVSNMGRVKSKERFIFKMDRGKYPTRVHLQGKILAFHINKGSIKYPRAKNLYQKYVHLRMLGRSRNFLVHRLVAKAFIPNPNHYSVVNHKDRNESNNKVSNLEWCTHHYNNIYDDANKRVADAESTPCILSKNKNKYYFKSVPRAAKYVLNKRKYGSYDTIRNNLTVAANPYNHNLKTAYGYKIKRLERKED